MSDNENNILAEEELQEENKHIAKVGLNDAIYEYFTTYAEYVIKSRAITMASDGLKPIQRRLLFAAKNMGLLHNSKRKKSAALCGEVIKSLSPHGNDSIYAAQVNMSQDFVKRYPLFDMLGNTGSVDADSAAAMRYTEVRLSKFGEALIASTNKDVVDYTPNYDNTTTEPKELASLFANSLLNGATGIAVGVATNTLPHYAEDVYKAIDKMIENDLNQKPTTDEEVISIIQAPDFPLGGVIINPSEIAVAYKNGAGKVKMRATYKIEKSGNKKQIVFDTIPYNVCKKKLVEEIGAYAFGETEDLDLNIADIRDESGRDGIRIVVELKKDAVVDVVLANLFKRTKLQNTISINNTMLDDNGKLIENVSLLNMIRMFVNHVYKFKTREYKSEYVRKYEKAFLITGILKAKANAKHTLDVIENAEDVIKALMADPVLSLTEAQAKAVADMKISSFNKINIERYIKDLSILKEQCEYIKSLFEDKNKFIEHIRSLVKEFASSNIFKGDYRRTEIVNIDDSVIEDRDLIKQENVIVTYSHEGLLKVVLTDDYNTQRRQAKGVDAKAKENDFIEKIISMTTKDNLLIMTNMGKCHVLPIYRIPIVSKQSQGKYISNYIDLENNEEIISILSGSLEDMDNNLMMLTKKGLIKRFSLTDLNSRRKFTKVISFVDDDSLADCCIVNDESEIIIVTSNGKALKIPVKNIRCSGKLAKGVKGIKLTENATAISLMEINDTVNTLLIVSSKGMSKRVSNDLLTAHGRGTAGVCIFKENDKSGSLVSVISIKDNDTIFIVTENNIVKRINSASIRETGRTATGVKLINLANGDAVKSISAAPAEEVEEDYVQQ